MYDSWVFFSGHFLASILTRKTWATSQSAKRSEKWKVKKNFTISWMKAERCLNWNGERLVSVLIVSIARRSAVHQCQKELSRIILLREHTATNEEARSRLSINRCQEPFITFQIANLHVKTEWNGCSLSETRISWRMDRKWQIRRRFSTRFYCPFLCQLEPRVDCLSSIPREF